MDKKIKIEEEDGRLQIFTNGGFTKIEKDDPEYNTVLMYKEQSSSAGKIDDIRENAPVLEEKILSRTEATKREYLTIKLPDNESDRQFVTAEELLFIKSNMNTEVIDGSICFNTLRNTILVCDTHGLPKALESTLYTKGASKNVNHYSYDNNSFYVIKEYSFTREEVSSLKTSIDLLERNNHELGELYEGIKRAVLGSCGNNLIYAILEKVHLGNDPWKREGDPLVEYILLKYNLTLLENIPGFTHSLRPISIIDDGSNRLINSDDLRLVFIDSDKAYQKGISINFFGKNVCLLAAESILSHTMNDGLYIYQKNEECHFIKLEDFSDNGIFDLPRNKKVSDDNKVNKLKEQLNTEISKNDSFKAELEKAKQTRETDKSKYDTKIADLNRKFAEERLKSSPFLNLLGFAKNVMTGLVGWMTGLAKLAVI